jgi:glycosyltransferase involved in cell wall biosynthesis
LKKRLLFIADNLKVGGVEKSLVSLLRCIDYQRYDVDLLLFKKEGLFLKQVPKDVNIITSPNYVSYFQVSKDGISRMMFQSLIKNGPLFTWKFLKGLLNGLKNKNMGIARQKLWVQLHERFPSYTGNYDAAVGFSGGLTTYFMMDKINAEKKLAWVHLDYRMLRQDDQINKSYFERCDQVVTVSPRCGEVLKEVFPELKNKIKVMYNIVSPTLINELSNEEPTLYDLEFKGLTILTMGRLSSQKGLDIAIPAVSQLAKDGYKFKWYVLGDGPEEEQIRKKIKEFEVEEFFVLLGTTDNPYPYLKTADIYAQPSRFEGKAIAIDESKILHKPILVTDFSTVKDQIKNRENGIIVPMSSEGIYNGLKKLLDSSSLRVELSRNLEQESVGNEYEINKFYEFISLKN